MFISRQWRPVRGFRLLDVTQTSVTFIGHDGHTYAFYCLATDNVGHQEVKSAAAEATTLVDLTPPTITLSVPTITNDSRPTGSVTVTDSGSGVPDGTSAFLDVDLNNDGDFTDLGETGYATLTLVGGTATFQPASPLPDGTYGLRVRASDLAGNEGTSAVSTMLVDLTPPTITLSVPTITNDSRPTGSVTVTDSGSGVPDGTSAFLDVDLNNDGDFTDLGETGYATLTLVGGTATFQPASPLPDGTYGLRVARERPGGQRGDKRGLDDAGGPHAADDHAFGPDNHERQPADGERDRHRQRLGSARRHFGLPGR